MMRFNNDYNHSAHECVLKLLEKTAGEGYGGYGEDEACRSLYEAHRGRNSQKSGNG